MNKKHITILIIIIVLVTVAGFLWYTKNNTTDIYSESNANSQNIVIPDTDRESHENIQEENAKILYNSDGTIDISNWQTYRNEEFGFEVMYPEYWTHESTNDMYGEYINIGYATCNGKNNYYENENSVCNELVTILVSNEKDEKLRVRSGWGWALSEGINCDQEDVSLLRLDVDRPVKSCMTNEFGYTHFRYYFKVKEYNYLLTIRYLDQQYNPVVERRILQSFKFIQE